MDLTNRGQRPQPSSDASGPRQTVPAPDQRKSRKLPHRSILLKIFQVGLLSCVAVLVIGILLSIATYQKNGEDDYVDSSKYQAVFLNDGQVYFGKITDLNQDYLTLSNIYYLRVDQQVQPDKEGQPQNNFTLAKLGCELHRPQDVMVVNKDQVVFWENLKDESGTNTVTGAIKQYNQTSGGVQNCDQQQTSSSTESPATTTDTSATDTTTTDTTNSTDTTTTNQ